MKKTKYFWDIDKEIKWLNTLATQGYRLVNKKCFTYYFDTCEKNTYLYQVTKQRFGKNFGNENYADFMSELNIQIVASQWGWHYLEHENNNKKFDIFSDIPSKIMHYKNLVRTFLLIAAFSVVLFGKNANPLIVSKSPYLIGTGGPYFFNVSVPLLFSIMLFIGSIFTSLKYMMKILKLKKAQIIYE